MHAITLDYDRNMARMEKVVCHCVCGGGTSSFEIFENGGQERGKKKESKTKCMSCTCLAFYKLPLSLCHCCNKHRGIQAFWRHCKLCPSVSKAINSNVLFVYFLILTCGIILPTNPVVHQGVIRWEF